MQQADGDGGVVHFEFGEYPCHGEGVDEVGLAAGALLVAVGLHAINIGAVDEPDIGPWVVGADFFDEFILAYHLCNVGYGPPPRQALRWGIGCKKDGVVDITNKLSPRSMHSYFIFSITYFAYGS